jgi:DNA polymerase III subunit alpha
LVESFAPRREVTEEGERLRGLRVRLRVVRDQAECEIDLDERALFYPTDAALNGWMSQAQAQNVRVVYS